MASYMSMDPSRLRSALGFQLQLPGPEQNASATSICARRWFICFGVRLSRKGLSGIAAGSSAENTGGLGSHSLMTDDWGKAFATVRNWKNKSKPKTKMMAFFFTILSPRAFNNIYQEEFRSCGTQFHRRRQQHYSPNSSRFQWTLRIERQTKGS